VCCCPCYTRAAITALATSASGALLYAGDAEGKVHVFVCSQRKTTRAETKLADVGPLSFGGGGRGAGGGGRMSLDSIASSDGAGGGVAGTGETGGEHSGGGDEAKEGREGADGEEGEDEEERDAGENIAEGEEGDEGREEEEEVDVGEAEDDDEQEDTEEDRYHTSKQSEGEQKAVAPRISRSSSTATVLIHDDDLPTPRGSTAAAEDRFAMSSTQSGAAVLVYDEATDSYVEQARSMVWRYMLTVAKAVLKAPMISALDTMI